MKKILCALLVGILLVGLAACSKSPTTPQSVDNPNATNSSPVTTPIGKGETGISEVLTEDPIESISQLLSYSIYVPNDNANGFVVETISTADISAETVLTELKKRNVLPEAVSVNNFHMDNGLITIDFNQAFADVVCSMGTSGELMVVGSVVNTFLDAFQAESVYFTVDGQILESGHVIYDFAMPFFSDYVFASNNHIFTDCGEKESAVIHTDYLPQELVPTTEGMDRMEIIPLSEEYDFFIMDDNQYSRCVVFSADTKVKNFELYRIAVPAGDKIEYHCEKPVLHYDDISSDKSIVIQMDMPETLPWYGISYTNESGDTVKYAIHVSGYDGSVVLEKFE